MRCAHSGCSAAPCTRVVTAPATTSRATSPLSTDHRNALSNLAAGGQWSNATCPSEAGSTASAAARTSAASASDAPCQGSRTSSCRSWTNRLAARFPPPHRDCTAQLYAACAASPTAPSTRNRAGDTRATNSPRAHTAPGRAGHDFSAEDREQTTMTTNIPEPSHAKREPGQLVEMAWDPITRIVGSLGIYTKIDFENREVVECHSTSSIFRGYSIFMKGKDPRDAHFITSRICGICGDNHATCSCYCQNMAYGVKPPPLGEWLVNLGEAAEYMFDHNIFQENLGGVDFCEKMVSETNPGVLAKAENTPAPQPGAHGYRTIADIMRSLNPFSGEFYREALQVSRYTREMFCLMEGRHVHPSTLYPGGVGTTATIQLFTDYYARLMRYVEFMKRVVPMHDDLFDFFYQALPGYEEVGRRRVLLGCWGAFQDPDVCNFEYKDMTQWGRAMGVTPGVVVDGKLVTNDLVEINLGIRILLGHSFYDDWEDQEMFVSRDPLGNPVDRRHPWNQHTNPQPQKRDFDGNYSWVMSPRWFDGKDHLALDTGGGPLARLWSTALSGLVNAGGYVVSTGHSVEINLPKTALKGPVSFEWKVPKRSKTLER